MPDPAPTPEAPRRSPPRFVQELDTLVRARYPLVYLVTSEEQRLEAILGELAQTHGKAVLAWSITRGFRRLDGEKAVPGEGKEPIRDPVARSRASRSWRSPRWWCSRTSTPSSPIRPWSARCATWPTR